MSYGWLTESALLPKPSKKINVDNSSLVDLSVMLEKEKKKRANTQEIKMPMKKVFVSTNKGVEARNRKDIETSTQEVINGQARLEEKAKIYEALMKGKDTSKGKYLVDFEGKKFDELTEDQLEQFESEKERFYEEQKRIAKERESNITNRRGVGEMTIGFEEQEIERLQWEAEALNDIEKGITEEMKDEMRGRVLVKQSYDKRVTTTEKEKLTEVLKEEEQDKKLSNDIKKKREETQRLRQEKLKKLTEKKEEPANNEASK